MRKRRFQIKSRRLLVIFFLLLVILVCSSYAYLSLRGEFLLRDFKIFIENVLSQAFDAKVSIGDIKGGIFYPITFSNVVLHSSSEGGHKILEASRIRINYHLWDLLFNRRKKVCNIRLTSPKFFIVPAEYYSSKIGRQSNSFFTPRIQLDIINGSIISSATGDFVAKEACGRVFISEDSSDLKNMTMNFYGLPVAICGKIDNLHSNSPNYDIVLRSQNDYSSVVLAAKGPSGDLAVEGDIELPNGAKINFATLCEFYKGHLSLKNTFVGNNLKIDEGVVDFNEKSFKLRLLSCNTDPGEVIINGKFEGSKILLQGDVKHWVIGMLDVATNMKLEAEFKQKIKTPILTGTFDTTNTIINYKPCEELSLQFALRKKILEILGLKWGKSFRLVGKIDLKQPYDIELIALLDGTKLEELVSFGGEELQHVVGGTVKGRLETKGPLATCISRGHITARDGHIGDVYYENTVIHLVGKGPLITIGDSRIYKEIGYLILSGEIDLRKLGKRNIFEDVVVKTDDQTIVWDGWDITKEPAAEMVSLKKKVNEQLEVGFKAPLADTGYARSSEDKEGGVELRYKIKDSENLKMQLKKEEEFLGVEHKIKF